MLNPAQTAFLFPGQGSQAIGMGAQLAEVYPEARRVFAEADEILNLELSRIAWEGPEETLNDTINTQPALLVHSVASLRLFQSLYPDFQPACTAGHSMGELSALVCAGSLPYASALSLVRLRGAVMKQAGEQNPGGMAAILGLDIPALEEVCRQASQPDEQVQVANDNCPGQVVISGANPALDRALELAKQAGAKRAVKLAVSIAAHSKLMEPAQQTFNRAVRTSPLTGPQIPIVGNVTARPLEDVAAIHADLEAQLTSRVRWTESIQWMISQGVTTFIELGSGNVLTGLLKRIDREAQGYTLSTPEDFARLAEML
jgi:[acyl-carrier-protein] S-malonyltransferase